MTAERRHERQDATVVRSLTHGGFSCSSVGLRENGALATRPAPKETFSRLFCTLEREATVGHFKFIQRGSAAGFSPVAERKTALSLG